MKIAITTRGYKAPERLKRYINDKLKRLDKFADRIIDIEAILSYENLDQVVEFKLRVNNKKVIVKEKTDDIFKSIDLAVDNIERQITKIKDKFRDRDKRKIVEMVS